MNSLAQLQRYADAHGVLAFVDGNALCVVEEFAFGTFVEIHHVRTIAHLRRVLGY